MKILIKNGIIYSGSNDSGYRSNILIDGERIACITNADDIAADIIIDAEGRAITPGFIDSHRHCDIAAIVDDGFGDIELSQGITTTLAGNCGLTPFPTVDRYRESLYDFIEPCLGKAPDWMEFKGFRDYIGTLEESNPYINIGAFIGTGAIKVAVKGFDNTPFTPLEMDRARGYIIEAMESGAFGVSTGIMYVPECYSTAADFISLIKPLARYGATLTCHIRGEGRSLVSSIEEVIHIGREAGVPINISHFKAVRSKDSDRSILQAIDKIEKARAAGQDVTVDFYPYTSGSTSLITLLPPIVLEQELDRTLLALSKPQGKDRLKQLLYKDEHDGWDNMVQSIGWENIIINSVKEPQNKKFQGVNIQYIASKLGYEDPADFVCDLFIHEKGKVGIILMSMAQEDVDTIARLPYSSVISDALYGDTDSPHPRLYGSFPRIIRDYVVERKILSLETAINKMTYMPAKRFGIKDRGILEEGSYADINIFYPERLADGATYRAPKQLSTGMDMVFINGELVWENNKRTGTHAAKTLRRVDA